MAQYIELDAAVEEVERRISSLHPKGGQGMVVTKILKDHYKDYLSFLNTLEVKEVDLEKHLKEYIEDVFFDLDGVAVKGATHYITVEDVKDLAKRFFELGLKAKNWEKERMKECPYRQVGCTMYEGKILECRGACSWVVDYPKLKELKAQKGK